MHSTVVDSRRWGPWCFFGKFVWGFTWGYKKIYGGSPIFLLNYIFTAMLFETFGGVHEVPPLPFPTIMPLLVFNNFEKKKKFQGFHVPAVWRPWWASVLVWSKIRSPVRPRPEIRTATGSREISIMGWLSSKMIRYKFQLQLLMIKILFHRFCYCSA